MTKRLEWSVPKADLRLDQAVGQADSTLSRRRARALIEGGAIFVDGRRCKVASRRLEEGARLTIFFERPDAVDKPPVLYEDDDIVVIDKPAGMHVNETETTASVSVAQCFSGVHIVHRLDRDTTGALVLAKSKAAAVELSSAFQQRTVHKVYGAIVKGRPPDGWIDAPIGADRRRPQARAVRPDGRAARTQVRVLGERGGVSVVRLRLATGRTHQLRVHLAHVVAPIVGDLMYGGPVAVRIDGQILRPGRPLLHAHQLAFEQGGRTHRFVAPFPEDFHTGLSMVGPIASFEDNIVNE